MILRLILIFFFTFLIFNSKADNRDKIIKSLNNTSNFNFQFEQNINGKIESGNCTIEYPKKIYCSYNKNEKILVSNGKSLVIKNKTNNQFYIYPLEKTPLVFILDKENIIKKIIETDVSTVNDKFYMISFEENNNNINIFFDKNSLNILGWQTEDLYQNLAVTYIFNLQKNIKIDKKKLYYLLLINHY